MKNNEVLRSVEIDMSRNSKQASGQAAITVVQVEQVMTRRGAMLVGIERYLTVKLRKHLREKIDLEKMALMEMVARRDALQQAAKKAVHLLNKAFFEQRPLDPSLLD